MFFLPAGIMARLEGASKQGKLSQFAKAKPIDSYCVKLNNGDVSPLKKLPIELTDTAEDDDEKLPVLLSSNGEMVDSFASNHLEKKALYGLKNFGNTCYINSSLQSLFALKFFVDELMSNHQAFKEVDHDEIDFQESLPIMHSLVILYQKYFKCLTDSNHEEQLCNDLKNFKKVFGDKFKTFDNNHQQDAAEMVSRTLEGLKQEFELFSAKFPTERIREPVSRFFEYELVKKTICDSCQTVSQTSDVEKHFTLMFGLTPEGSLQTSFVNSFSETHKVEAICSTCQSQLSAKTFFRKVPKVMFIQVGRYCQAFSKLNDTFVAPPLLTIPSSFKDKTDIDDILLTPLATPYKRR